jgi:hypothetical protein
VNANAPPSPFALVCRTKASTLRMQVELPLDYDDDEYQGWGYSIGESLRIGMRHLYLLDGNELDFELEPMWEQETDGHRYKVGTLTFVDGAVGHSLSLQATASYAARPPPVDEARPSSLRHIAGRPSSIPSRAPSSTPTRPRRA